MNKSAAVVLTGVIVLVGACQTASDQNKDKARRDEVVKNLSSPPVCIADLVSKASYSDSIKKELSPKLGATFSGVGASIELKYVDDSTVSLQVEKNSDTYLVQMSLAINLAECMDTKAAAVMDSVAFKSLPQADQDKFRINAYSVTNTYRTQVMALLTTKTPISKEDAKKPDTQKKVLSLVGETLAKENAKLSANAAPEGHGIVQPELLEIQGLMSKVQALKNR